jgi:hypothetical protein
MTERNSDFEETTYQIVEHGTLSSKRVAFFTEIIFDYSLRRNIHAGLINMQFIQQTYLYELVASAAISYSTISFEFTTENKSNKDWFPKLTIIVAQKKTIHVIRRHLLWRAFVEMLLFKCCFSSSPSRPSKVICSWPRPKSV